MDLNQALDQVPKSYTISMVKNIYNELCQSSKMLHSVTTQEHFKFDNFLKCVGLRFPETSSANINIRLVLRKYELLTSWSNICTHIHHSSHCRSHDHTRWTCVICKPEKSCESVSCGMEYYPVLSFRKTSQECLCSLKDQWCGQRGCWCGARQASVQRESSPEYYRRRHRYNF